MWVAIAIIVLVLSGGALGAILIDGPNRREITELSFPNINFSKLRDGTYIGEYKGTKSHLRDTTVEVTLAGGEISNIKVLKGAVDKDGKPLEMRGGKSIDELFDKVVKSESLHVDVISGATLSSNTHLKALANALEQAEIK
ncbi:MAG: FMN-binding protein [Clostridiaceae bacterium]